MECVVGGDFGGIAKLADTDDGSGNGGLVGVMPALDASSGDSWEMVGFSDGFEKSVGRSLKCRASCYTWEANGKSEDSEKTRC